MKIYVLNNVGSGTLGVGGSLTIAQGDIELMDDRSLVLTHNHDGDYADINHNHDGSYEPVISPKNSAFNQNFAGNGAATTIARSDHNHDGSYEPVISPKNSAFNQNFAGNGAATTIARSDHNHNGQTVVVGNHGTASTDEVINVCYGTSATPPAVGTVTEGALYIQYTA